LLALQRKWALLGGVEFRTESSERLASQDDLRENLICIGGPDANPVTRLILDRTSTTLVVVNGSVTFFDTETGRYFSPQIDAGRDRRDYGIIVRTRNPFNLERAALVLAGSFGDGTQAAAELDCEERIERSDFAAAGMTFELLLEVEVISGAPQIPRIVVLRGLDPASRRAQACVISPWGLFNWVTCLCLYEPSQPGVEQSVAGIDAATARPVRSRRSGCHELMFGVAYGGGMTRMI
jgi:hypothetical protein